MAGIQQAVNSLTGAIGTVGGRIGVYNELVGKTQELIKKTQAQNVELTKKNEELEDKNKLIEQQYNNLKAANEASLEQSQITGNLAERLYANVRARASRDIMLDVVYGEKPTAGPTRDFAKELIKQERERKEGGK